MVLEFDIALQVIQTALMVFSVLLLSAIYDRMKH